MAISSVFSIVATSFLFGTLVAPSTKTMFTVGILVIPREAHCACTSPPLRTPEGDMEPKMPPPNERTATVRGDVIDGGGKL